MFKELYAMGKVICKYSNMREDYIQREQNCFPNCAFHLNRYDDNTMNIIILMKTIRGSNMQEDYIQQEQILFPNSLSSKCAFCLCANCLDT